MNCEQELTALREAIRNERKNKRITQEELAEMLEVSPTHVKNETPHDATRGKIERLLDVSDEASLQFILSVLEALREKEQADVR